MTRPGLICIVPRDEDAVRRYHAFLSILYESNMFGIPILIVVVAALAATGLAALGLRVFFRLLDPSPEAEPLPSTESSRDRA